MTALLATKLHQPALPTKWVKRLQLIQRLNAGLESGHQFFLISAPAGFGKTTCASEWIATLELPVTWLALDSADDDPGRFFTYLIAALQKVNASIGQEIEAVLRSGQLPPAEIISTMLINDILNLSGGFLLVLDDFHVIQDQIILEFLERLATTPPQQLYLVLLTREDPPLPLARLRGYNRLTEIRARDLRFIRHDIERFLKNVMGLSLSQTDISTLEDKTEGWIVGLQLAGLSVRNQDDASRFITTLNGSHRHILGYLTEQVLNQQPEEIRIFLLQTSILDKLNGDLCNEVTGRSDSHALLERLLNANLFLVPLDDEGQWYRYHHLFADLLHAIQSTLRGDELTQLHQRASRWYFQADMTSEAIQHALSAKDFSMAMELLESHAMEMIMQGFVKTVENWAQALPDEWIIQSPRTNLAFAWAYMLRGAYAQANPYLERLRVFFEKLKSQPEAEDPVLKAEWIALQSLMLYRQRKRDESKAMAVRALEIIPEHENRVRSLAYYALASGCWLSEDYTDAVDAYRLSIQYGQAGNNPMAEIMSAVGLSGMMFEHGQLHQAFEIASDVIQRIERYGALPPISAAVYASLGDVYYQWYQLEEAQRFLLHALHLSLLGGSNSVTLFCRVLLSRQYQMEGDLEAAAHELQIAADLLPVNAPEYTEQEVLSQQVRLHLACNRLLAAEIALQGHGFSFQNQFAFPDLPPVKEIHNSLGSLYNSSLRVLLYQARAENELTHLRSGIELADRLLTRAFQSQLLLMALETLLIRAQMYALLGNQSAARTDYVKALELAEPEGFIGIFVEHGESLAKDLMHLVKRKQLGSSVLPEYVQRIISAFSESRLTQNTRPAPVPSAKSEPEPLFEPLTERELDVLRLIADGLKYKEIAASLFISQNTVRFHIKSIYGKLNASNRTQAIERAHQLQVL